MTGERPSPHFPTAADVLAGETADVYFQRARTILAAEGLDPVVTMEIFSRGAGVLCGAEEAIAYLREIFAEANGTAEPIVESLHDGDRFEPKEVVMRIQARYSAFGLYETAILGILASSSGWATAARRIVDAADPIPVIGFGARHVHPQRGGPDGLRVGRRGLHRGLHAGRGAPGGAVSDRDDATRPRPHLR